MVQINLLPWRERARKKRKLQVTLSLLMAAGLSFSIIIILHLYYHSLIVYQTSRNVFLQDQISEINAQITKLNLKQKTYKEIEEKIKFLISLKKSSYQAIGLLNEIPKIVPDGVIINNLTRQKKLIVILGKAQSEAQITLMMRNMAKSTIFNQPTLTKIESKNSQAGNETIFQLNVIEQD